MRPSASARSHLVGHDPLVTAFGCDPSAARRHLACKPPCWRSMFAGVTRNYSKGLTMPQWAHDLNPPIGGKSLSVSWIVVGVAELEVSRMSGSRPVLREALLTSEVINLGSNQVGDGNRSNAKESCTDTSADEVTHGKREKNNLAEARDSGPVSCC